jgi:SEC-C motif-containing protein
MRSRYSAYALGELAYLETTWHPDSCPPDLALDPEIRWIGLEILAFEPGETAARVEFEARFLAHDTVDAVHECSSFVREQGKWMYTERKLPLREREKIQTLLRAALSEEREISVPGKPGASRVSTGSARQS